MKISKVVIGLILVVSAIGLFFSEDKFVSRQDPRVVVLTYIADRYSAATGYPVTLVRRGDGDGGIFDTDYLIAGQINQYKSAHSWHIANDPGVTEFVFSDDGRVAVAHLSCHHHVGDIVVPTWTPYPGGTLFHKRGDLPYGKSVTLVTGCNLEMSRETAMSIVESLDPGKFVEIENSLRSMYTVKPFSNLSLVGRWPMFLLRWQISGEAWLWRSSCGLLGLFGFTLLYFVWRSPFRKPADDEGASGEDSPRRIRRVREPQIPVELSAFGAAKVDPLDWTHLAEQLRFECQEALTGPASDEAHELFKKGEEAKNARRKARFFKRVLQVIASEQDSAPVPTAQVLVQQPPKVEGKMKNLTLYREILRLFPVPDFVPGPATPQAVWVILIALLKPGSGKNLWGSNYMPKDSLYRDVRRHADTHNMAVTPNDFDKSLGWLVKIGLLKQGNKTDEPTFALVTNGLEDEYARSLYEGLARIQAGING